MRPPTSSENEEKAAKIQTWSAIKLRVHRRSIDRLYFFEREVWWANIGENIGSEINGKHDVFERPVIIVRKLGGPKCFVVPVTSQPKRGSWFFSYDFDGGQRCAVIAEMRVISSKRLIRRMGSLSREQFAALQEAIISLIKNGASDGFGGSSDPLSRTR